MLKKVLDERVAEVKNDTKTALQTLFNNINKGQQKQLVKKQQIKELFDRYGVEY
ncbi:MAG: hypothetical protein U0L88_11935 [Acutalibacteraceae bacterium]|nr:hypothetical protein [Acutalibacteraceae bacterium]